MPQNLNLIETAFNVMKFFIPFLFALCFHEFAHGFVARLRGDRTAEIMGRLTLNPMAHADPIGTVLFPILAQIYHIPLFGWAKPVPVDERNLKNPKVDMFWIALAGPMSNLLLGFVGAIAIGLYVKFNASALGTDQQGAIVVLDLLKAFVSINVFLAVFNLLPVHPLDGGKIIARFLPHHLNRKLEDLQQYTGIFMMVMFVAGGFWIISAPAGWLANLLLGIARWVALA